jgi:hypothetical protein
VRGLSATTVLATLTTLAALVVPAPTSATAAQPALSSCFWEGPISMSRPTTEGFDGRLFNFPEESATYWLARLHIPEGGSLHLRGRYAHARYQSLNAYSEGTPTDALPDVATRPRPGSINPFIAGNRRDSEHRSYTVEVADLPPPQGERAPNTLYARPEGDAPIELLYRVYEPDRGLDLTGDTGLPRPIVRTSEGTRLRGADACAAVNDPNREIPVQTTSTAQWTIAKNAPGCDPQVAPAVPPARGGPRWDRFFNFDYARLGFALGCTDAARQAHRELPHEDTGGFYSNGDIRYLFTMLSRQFGPVLVVRAKMPRFPATYGGARRMPAGQLRFWSLCSTESSVTGRTEDCLADRQVPLGAHRRFEIVVSKAADRPANARRRCGVAWLRWAEAGDGAGRSDFGQLVIRNMLPAADFEQAIQNVAKLDTERAVMGPYHPEAAYESKQAFEAGGCR